MRKLVMLNMSAIAVVMAAVLISGCATPQSKMQLRRETTDYKLEQTMVRNSIERFNEGDFWVLEWGTNRPAAIVVDLKDDDYTIKFSRNWRKLNSPKELEEFYERGRGIKAAQQLKLYRIEGPDGDLWGKFYAYQNRLPITMVDDHTIEIGDIPEPLAPR